MLLKSITLENFRQYKNEQKIVFSTDSDKPITVILGKNTGGKTTLIQAFLWCLYGFSAISFKDKEIINQEKLYELYDKEKGCIANVRVAIELVHGNKTYKIMRETKYEATGFQKTNNTSNFRIRYLDEQNGDVKIIKQDKEIETINNILPQQLSDYFFFLGERIEKLDSKANLSATVRDFLGLTIIDKSRSYLKKIVNKYDSTEFASLGDDEAAISNEIEKLNLEIESNSSSIINKVNENEKYTTMIEKYEVYMSEKKDSSILKSKIDQERINLKKLDKQLQDSKDKIITNFNNNASLFFSESIAKKALEKLDLPDEEVGLAYQNKKSLDELIARGFCLCGNDLTNKESESYKNFIAVFDQIAPKSIKSLCDEYKREIKRNEKIMVNYPEIIRKEFNSLREIEANIVDKKKEIDKLEEEMVGLEDLSGYRNKRKEFNSKLSLNQKEIGILETKNKLNEQKVKDLRVKLVRVLEKDEKNRKKLMYRNYAQAVLDDIDRDYEQKEKDVHVKLNNLVKEYFNEMYHGERTLTLNDKYRIELTNNVGGKSAKTEVSPGLETVKNFAFVAGLVEMAKEKIVAKSEEDDNQIAYEPYPLVLDAPFSQVDEVHVPNICKLLSRVAEQTIIVVMEKDWSFAEKVMRDNVGKYYVLNKHTETFTTVEEILEKEAI